ncbi:MAG TPA: hypothetical protein VFD68_09290 [Gemmatimonadales bacterium]|nr:hypothetical protein [Gemmatimonadales bacterium]
MQHALQLFHFALPEIQVGRGRVEPLIGPADQLRPGGIREPGELVQMLADLRRVRGALSGRADQVRPLYGRLDLDQPSNSSNLLTESTS